jgi:hypothetical protein
MANASRRLINPFYGGIGILPMGTWAGSPCHFAFGERSLYMPAKSKKQQMAAGAALAAKRGKRSKSSLRGASKQMAKSMSEKQLRDFAKTKRKKLPRKKT